MRALEVKEYQLSTWESCFKVFVEGEEIHCTKEVQRAIKIMKAIDPEFTQMLLTTEVKEEENEVTVYHGTHANITEFIDREVKTYDSIGTYFTSNKEYARMLYGKNVITTKIKLNNPLIVENVNNCESFDKVFYNNKLTKLSFNEDNMRKLLLDKNYINNLKKELINQGYDGIVFQDSRIDLDKTDKDNHTVYIVFNANQIRVAE